MATCTRAVSHRKTQPKPADATGRAPRGVPRANPGIPILLDPTRAPRRHLYPLDWVVAPRARRRQKASDDELTPPPLPLPPHQVAAMEGGSPTIVTNAEGGRTTPSVVAYAKNGDRLVGQVRPEPIPRFIRKTRRGCRRKASFFFSPLALRGSTTRWTCPTLGRAPRNRPRVSLLVPRRLTAPSLPLSSPSRRSPSARAS